MSAADEAGASGGASPLIEVSVARNAALFTAAKKIAALDLRRPIRFTGHLFFDGSYKPCTGTTPHGSSRRASAWEIHPVYAIEVCVNTLALIRSGGQVS